MMLSGLSIKKVFLSVSAFFLILLLQKSFSQESQSTVVDWSSPGEHIVSVVTKDFRHFWKEQINWPVISKDWKSVASKLRTGAKWVTNLNGISGSKYSEVRYLQFTPLGDTLIYIGTKGANQNFRRAVSIRNIQEKEERIYDEISATVFSPDGKFWAYRIRDDIDWYIVLNGKESQRYDYVELPQFSSDGNLFFYKAKLNGKAFLVVNGFEGKMFDDIFGVTINPINNDVAYWANENNEYKLIINETEINRFNRAPSHPNPILYSSNGKVFSYCVNEVINGQNNYHVIQNDVYSPPYHKVDWKEAKFSPDGNSIIFPAGKGNSEYIVLNTREEQKFEAVNSPIFSDDNFSVMYFAYENNKWFAVINKRKEKRFDMVKINLFQPKGDGYIYAAKENNKWFIVLNGIENEKKFDDILTILYSQNGEKLAYVAKVQESSVVAFNDIESNLYPKIDTILFSRDGNSLAYIVIDKDEKFVVINGYEGRRYKDILQIEVSPDGKRFGYFALDDKENLVWVVEES